MFEFIEEPLDQVAFPVECGIHRALNLSVALRGDVAAPAMCGDQLEDRTCIVTAVGNHVARGRMCGQQTCDRRLSEACPGDRLVATGRPRASTIALILVLNPPRERPRV